MKFYNTFMLVVHILVAGFIVVYPSPAWQVDSPAQWWFAGAAMTNGLVCYMVGKLQVAKGNKRYERKNEKS